MSGNKNKKVKKTHQNCQVINPNTNLPCNQDHCPGPNSKIGDSVGESPILAANIADGKGQTKENYIQNHKLYSTVRNHRKTNTPIAELQAHHLICSEAMDDQGKAPQGGHTWEDLCNWFGYDINCKENGVFLPSNMAVACAYKVPLHKGNHEATETDMGINYVNAVKNKIDSLKNMLPSYCKKPSEFIKKLNRESGNIFNKVKDFKWILTADGKDYNSDRGCMNYKTISEK